MRILFAAHNCYTDNTSGAARSMRTIVEWMAAAGHQCRAISTARFDAKAPDSMEDHLESLEIRPNPVEARRLVRSGSASRPVWAFEYGGVAVTMLVTRQNDALRRDADESEQVLTLVNREIKSFAPDVVLTYGSHPVVSEILRTAKIRGSRTVFSLRNFGYEHRRWFEHVDAALTNSPYLSRYYYEKIGLMSTGIVSPIDWSEVVAPDESRVMLTFVNPSLAKGAAVFARLADMLGAGRPDIPIMVVQSAVDATSLNSIRGIDFGKYPQIMAAPPVPHPRDYLELTRVLLVPSVFNEPFGRVAAEAMINGIPALVSDRGALAETVDDGGIVLDVPDWLTPNERRIPDEAETQPWFDAVTRLWDDEHWYADVSARARKAAERLYSEAALKDRYAEFFEGLREMIPLFA